MTTENFRDLHLHVQHTAVTLTAGARRRYAEDVCAGDPARAVAPTIAAVLCQHGTVTLAPPEWLPWTRREHDAYLLLGEDIAFPLRRDGALLLTTTCLVRGRNARRRHPRAAGGPRRAPAVRPARGRATTHWRDEALDDLADAA